MKTPKSKRKKKRIPTIKFRQELFWDVNPKKIDPDKHAKYIIERILDFGNDREVRWLAHRYSSRRIADVVESSRVLHDKSKILWSLIFH